MWSVKTAIRVERNVSLGCIMGKSHCMYQVTGGKHFPDFIAYDQNVKQECACERLSNSLISLRMLWCECNTPQKMPLPCV